MTKTNVQPTPTVIGQLVTAALAVWYLLHMKIIRPEKGDYRLKGSICGRIKRSSPPSPFGKWERCTAWSPTAMAWCAVRSTPTTTPV